MTVTLNPYYYIMETNAGWIGMTASSLGLLKLSFPMPLKEKALIALGDSVTLGKESPEYFKNTITELEKYFQGNRVVFTTELDLSRATVFERSVWMATRYIPYGETRSYLEIARQVGKPLASRAVGQALGRNPIPIIIPCHRVIGNDGKIGGFGGGLEMKRYLLHLESGGR